MAKMREIFEPFVMFLLGESLVPLVRIPVSQNKNDSIY
jgi:hypothetical protein